ncbi:transmembrane protein 154 isoform X2 [Brachyistius frenatus]|uniref:transmembrane protein 154 isoform X2 n=1 Tax=Brachyistius frenatus TaxID=100188 RepID=UPI0037E9A972
MSASRPCNMRCPQVKTPQLLLLLLLTTLIGTVFCQDEDDTAQPETHEEVSDTESAADTALSEDTGSDPVEETDDNTSSGEAEVIYDNISTSTSTESTSFTYTTIEPDEDQGLGSIIILIPVVLVVLIIGMIVCGFFLNRRWNKKPRNQELSKEDPYLDGSSTEKVPMPMFEEDVPSVLELEMEEFDQWMKKDGEAAEEHA